MQEVYFVDTTIRDGQMSLWATNMKTEMMRPILSRMDEAGFKAIEVFATAFFKKCVSELREDPWERFELIAKHITKTPLRMITGLRSGIQTYPPSVFELLLERLVAHGIRQARLTDPANNMSSLSQAVRIACKAGLEPIANIIFSVSPKHTDEYYAQKAREAAAMDVMHLCLKDPGGLLTPDRIRTLVPVLMQNSSGKLDEIHTHCTTGLGPLCVLETIKLGIKTVDTAIPPLAEASSLPSVFNVARNAQVLGYRPMIDEEPIRIVSEHFMSVAKEANLPIGAPVQNDAAYYSHQMPGGMISNLRHQLTKQGSAGRLEEVLQETARVRADLGYPIMVTPYSQYVGTHASMNVILGERYKQVSDEIIKYALGFYGEEEASSIDPNVRDKILDRPRAKQLAGSKPSEPSVDELRKKWGGTGISDDEVLLRYFAGDQEVAAMRATAPRSST
jgi:oxaloacetate decarboxylase alpha subunit